MTDEDWHATAMLLDHFVADPGAVGSATASSLEAHLLACDRCRAGVDERVGASFLEDSWHRVADVIDRPHESVVERVLIRLGLTDTTARLVAGTPALTLAALGSVVFLAVASVASSRLTDTTGSFLVVAPLLPLLAVAAAFASAADPVGEVGVPTPLQGAGLVLRRAAVVLTTVFIVLGAADLAIGHLDAPVVAWVLPGLALPVCALALATWVRVEIAAGSLAVAWVAVVSSVRWLDRWSSAYGSTATFGRPGQMAMLAVLLVSSAVAVLRRDRFDLMDEVR